MYVYDHRGGRLELELVDEHMPTVGDAIAPRRARALLRTAARSVSGARAMATTLEGASAFDGASALDTGAAVVTRVARTFFDFTADKVTRPSVRRGAPPVMLRERDTGLLRVVYRELVVRFRARAPVRTRRQILAKLGLAVRRRSVYVPDQVVLYRKDRSDAGVAMVDLARRCAELDEVRFAIPNFVSEYTRDDDAFSVPAGQWHLRNTGEDGQRAGEDIRVEEAWKITRGKWTIGIAVLDDGVDIGHPNLRSRIMSPPDPDEPRDVGGRDFFLPMDHPAHFDPRPKVFQTPYTSAARNDIHGTPCAGLLVADGKDGPVGVAPKCKLLPVKIFHASQLAADEHVANAIRYAALHARVLSCSWHGGRTPDVELAIEEDAAATHGGRGAAVFCAAGNWGDAVNFPASSPGAIAVGATTDGGTLAEYSNRGTEVALVAPSSGGVRGIVSTDVSTPGYAGYAPAAAPSAAVSPVEGDEPAGDADGLVTDRFGGTSAATPIAAGVGALVLAADIHLDRDGLRDVLTRTARKIGDGYDDQGHSDAFGHGCVDAATAVDAVV